MKYQCDFCKLPAVARTNWVGWHTEEIPFYLPEEEYLKVVSSHEFNATAHHLKWCGLHWEIKHK